MNLRQPSLYGLTARVFYGGETGGIGSRIDAKIISLIQPKIKTAFIFPAEASERHGCNLNHPMSTCNWQCSGIDKPVYNSRISQKAEFPVPYHETRDFTILPENMSEKCTLLRSQTICLEFIGSKFFFDSGALFRLEVPHALQGKENSTYLEISLAFTDNTKYIKLSHYLPS